MGFIRVVTPVKIVLAHLKTVDGRALVVKEVIILMRADITLAMEEIKLLINVILRNVILQYIYLSLLVPQVVPLVVDYVVLRYL